jgi:hypothetical protein
MIMKLKYTYHILSRLRCYYRPCVLQKRSGKDQQNPNASEIAQPDYLLTAATKATADTYWGTANNMDASLLFVQHWAKIQYTDPDRYIYTNTSFQDLWTTGYAKSIVNLNQVIKLADAQANPNYKGVALVLRSWVFTLLTDNYGDIPYTQAANIDENLTPGLRQAKRRLFCLAGRSENGASRLNTAGTAIAGDVIYTTTIALMEKVCQLLTLAHCTCDCRSRTGKGKASIGEYTSRRQRLHQRQ